MNEKRGTCWVGYQQIGMKKKGNKMVPNCVKEIVDIYWETELGEKYIDDVINFQHQLLGHIYYGVDYVNKESKDILILREEIKTHSKYYEVPNLPVILILIYKFFKRLIISK